MFHLLPSSKGKEKGGSDCGILHEQRPCDLSGCRHRHWGDSTNITVLTRHCTCLCLATYLRTWLHEAKHSPCMLNFFSTIKLVRILNYMKFFPLLLKVIKESDFTWFYILFISFILKRLNIIPMKVNKTQVINSLWTRTGVSTTNSLMSFAVVIENRCYARCQVYSQKQALRTPDEP